MDKSNKDNSILGKTSFVPLNDLSIISLPEELYKQNTPFDIITSDSLSKHKPKNTLRPFPNPSIELFEHIGKSELFSERFDEDPFFSEILMLLLPASTNKSVFFFQKNFNSLILSKDDLNFFNEYSIALDKEPQNVSKIHASIGALHYIYLMYYEWLINYKTLELKEDYEQHNLDFFKNFSNVCFIIEKYSLNYYLRYTTNFFYQNSIGQDLFKDILLIGEFIVDYFNSLSIKKEHIFKTKITEYEVEYLKLVKTFITYGENELGNKETVNLSDEQITSILNSLSFHEMIIKHNNGLWIHLDSIQTFIKYVQRYTLLKNIHSVQNENNKDKGDSGSGRKKI